MSQAKRDLEEHEDLLTAIDALGIEEKALNRRTGTFMPERSANGLRAI